MPAATAKGCPNLDAATTATAPLAISQIKVAAAAQRLPVRKTLVAPILLAPIWRTSPAPASQPKIRPNGTEPSKYPNANATPISNPEHAVIGEVTIKAFHDRNTHNVRVQIAIR